MVLTVVYGVSSHLPEFIHIPVPEVDEGVHSQIVPFLVELSAYIQELGQRVADLEEEIKREKKNEPYAR